MHNLRKNKSVTNTLIARTVLGACLFSALVSGCASPSSIYPSYKPAGVYLQIPRQWHEISTTELAQQEKKSTAAGAAERAARVQWQIAYSSSPNITAADVFSLKSVSDPIIFIRIRSLSDYESNAVSLNSLRDVIVPITDWIAGISSISRFDLAVDEPFNDKGGSGIHSRYTFGAESQEAQTLDQRVVLTPDRKTLIVVVARCSEICFKQNREALDTITSSFRVVGK